jgi:hypothetical protein
MTQDDLLGPLSEGIERLPEYVRKYSDDKSALSRFGGTLALISLIVAFAARTPWIRFVAEASGVKGEIHSGYLLVYGEPLLFVLALVYWARLADLYAFLAAIRTTIASNPRFQLLPVERALLRPPFTIQELGHLTPSVFERILNAMLKWTAPICVPLVALACYLTLIGGFFHDFGTNHRWLDLLFGVDSGLRGFKPSADVPYIYFFNTWINIIGFVFMVSLLTWNCLEMRRSYTAGQCTQ